MKEVDSKPIANSIQFLNLSSTDISPFVKRAVCKVFYLGQNRNGSDITRETAIQMGKGLRSCPVVGHYILDKKDFGSHDSKITIENGEWKEECQTIPYGFVPTDSKVWLEDFEDTNELGETVKRTYLLCECLLWLENFPELNKVIENGTSQSMELNNDTIEGHWVQSINSNREFFIIDHADITKLCMLGDDVQACFEDAWIGNIDYQLKDNKDKNMFNLNKMIEQYSSFYSNKKANMNEGEKSMDQLKELQAKYDALAQEKDKLNNDFAAKNAVVDETNAKYEKSVKENAELNTKYEAVAKELEELKANYSKLEETNKSLVEENTKLKEFQKEITDQAKTDMINSFSTLTEEDKKDVVANKDNYSLEDIESKLSIIFTRKSKENSSKKKEEGNEKIVTAFGLDNNADNIPALAKALANNRK